MKDRTVACDKVRAGLTAYLAGELKPARSAAVRGHLAGCADCRARARDLAAALDAVREALLEGVAPPVGLDPAERARIRAARRPAVVRVLFSPRRLAEAAVMVLVLGVLAALSMPAMQSGLSRSHAGAEVAARRAQEAAEWSERTMGKDTETVLPAHHGWAIAPEPRSPVPAPVPPRRPAVVRRVEDGREDVRRLLATPERPLGRVDDARDLGLSLGDSVAPGDREFERGVSRRIAQAEEGSLGVNGLLAAGVPAAREMHEAESPGADFDDMRLADAPVDEGFLSRLRAPRLAQRAPSLPAAPATETPPDRADEVLAFLYDRAEPVATAVDASGERQKDDRAGPVPPDAIFALPTMPEPEAEEVIATHSDEEEREVLSFNTFVDTAEQVFSTFSMDVDTASYAQARAHILGGQRPPPELVRTEEFLNAFDYDYTPPASGVFAIDARLLPSPFRPGLQVLRIGIKAQRVGRDQDRNAMLTLVIDTSGSMDTPDRLGHVRRALPQLVEALGPDDELAIVQFDRRARFVLPPTRAAEQAQVVEAVEQMAVGGGTNLEDGLTLGYQIAAQNFRAGASNRVMLLTDGVANLGATTADELLAAVAAHRRQGIYLTVLGFGMGAYDDELLKSLAQRGDGAYAFIDSEAEARRVLVDDLAATLHTVANDAKIQVEFNPARVARYRQIGYERRQLAKEDFRDDTVDAGEVGSGQSVTALYELELHDAPNERIGTVFIRYEEVGTGRVIEQARVIGAGDRLDRFEHAPPRTQLAVAAAEFGEVLRGNPHTAGTDLGDVARQLRPVADALPLDGQVQELLRLVEAARRQPEW